MLELLNISQECYDPALIFAGMKLNICNFAEFPTDRCPESDFI